MTDPPAFVRPAPLEGHGVYNRSSRVQAAGLSPAVPLLEQAARAVALSAAPQPVVIADYGCSDPHGACGVVGTRSRAIRVSATDGRVRRSASDGRCVPARPALHVSTRLLHSPPSFLVRLRLPTPLHEWAFRTTLHLLWTCCAGRAGTHRRSKALMPALPSGNLPAVRPRARPYQGWAFYRATGIARRTLAVDPNIYLRGDPAVFTSVIGRWFYEQILPAGSVTLAWSSWAVQWLSWVPASIPDQVQVACSRDPPARGAFAGQAAEDWRTFLSLRFGKEDWRGKRSRRKSCDRGFCESWPGRPNPGNDWLCPLRLLQWSKVVNFVLPAPKAHTCVCNFLVSSR